MEYKEIQELIKLVKKSKISELDIKKGDFKISIKSEGANKVIQQVAPQPAAPQPVAQPQVNVQKQTSQPATTQAKEEAPKQADSDLVEIKSPMIGTFYRAAGPDKDPFVSIGDTVKKGQVICMVEAMKLFNEIEAEVDGKIVKILVEDATPIEFDQPLFLVDPKA